MALVTVYAVVTTIAEVADTDAVRTPPALKPSCKRRTNVQTTGHCASDLEPPAGISTCGS
jgi:hypothetical protein